jgi:hypothetical protein
MRRFFETVSASHQSSHDWRVGNLDHPPEPTVINVLRLFSQTEYRNGSVNAWEGVLNLLVILAPLHA